MSDDHPGPRLPRRTAEEAVAQADAKDRIRTARGVRGSGAGLVALGVAFLTKPGAWSAYNQAVGIRIHGGPYFTLSFDAVVGILAVVVGPLVFVAGHWWLRRAIVAARRDPVTARIFDLLEP